MNCYFCGMSDNVGGAWVSIKNSCYFSDRQTTIRIRKGELEGHALCKLLEQKGYAYVEGKLTKMGVETYGKNE